MFLHYIWKAEKTCFVKFMSHVITTKPITPLELCAYFMLAFNRYTNADLKTSLNINIQGDFQICIRACLMIYDL